MRDCELYARILGIQSPWRVVDVELDNDRGEITVRVSYGGTLWRTRLGPLGPYMATLTAIRCHPTIRDAYLRLRAAGKCAKVALVACMRKLLTILNAIIRDNHACHQNPPLTP